MKPKNIEVLRISSLPVGTTWFLLNSMLLLLITAIPSGMTAWFDGLPWSGRVETVLMMVLIPALLITGWRFLCLKGVSVVLTPLNVQLVHFVEEIFSRCLVIVTFKAIA